MNHTETCPRCGGSGRVVKQSGVNPATKPRDGKEGIAADRGRRPDVIIPTLKVNWNRL